MPVRALPGTYLTYGERQNISRAHAPPPTPPASMCCTAIPLIPYTPHERSMQCPGILVNEGGAVQIAGEAISGDEVCQLP